MPLPVNLMQTLSRSLLADTAVCALSHVTSVTDGLDIPTLVTQGLAKQPIFYFLPQNDFGMLIDMLGAVAYNNGISNDRYKDLALYDELRAKSAYVDSAVHDLAYSLAGLLISAHTMLRDVISDNVTALMGLIETMLKDRVETDTLSVPAVVVQNWGQLGDEAYRLRMMYTCRSWANIFEEGRPIRKYYALAALAGADRLKDLELPESLRAEAANCLAGILGECSESYMRFYNSVLFRSYGIKNFVAAARVALEGGAELERGLSQLVQLETLIQTISVKSTSSELCAELSDWLAQKLPLLEQVCLLCAGAYYTLAVTTYQDTLVLAADANHVLVNGFRMASFEAAGGSLELLSAFGYYLDAHHMRTPSSGWSEHRVLAMQEQVTADILTARTERERRLQADNSVLLRAVIDRSVTQWLEESDIINNLKTPEVIAKRALATLLTKSTNPELALSDLLTDFCIELRNAPILNQLKAAIFQEFSTLATADGAPSIGDRNTAITKALIDVLLGLVISRYGESL